MRPIISFLITHYNRPKSLIQCVESIIDYAKEHRHEIVVSDDCSTPENIGILKAIPGIKLILAEQKQGLAANINKGLRACSGNFIVYIQDDFLLINLFKIQIPNALKLLNNGDLDMIRLTSYTKFKYSHVLLKSVGIVPRFSLSNIPVNHLRYSDQPFIVRADFFAKYGFYMEGTSTYYGENEFMVRMMKLNPKVGIVIPQIVDANNVEASVNESLHQSNNRPDPRLKKLKLLAQYLRFEWEALNYNPSKRGLKTYANKRKA